MLICHWLVGVVDLGVVVVIVWLLHTACSTQHMQHHINSSTRTERLLDHARAAAAVEPAAPRRQRGAHEAVGRHDLKERHGVLKELRLARHDDDLLVALVAYGGVGDVVCWWCWW